MWSDSWVDYQLFHLLPLCSAWDVVKLAEVAEQQGLRAGMRDYTVSYVMCLQILLKLAHIHQPSKEEADEIHLTRGLVFVCFLLAW